jgi:hypothetical protein
MKNGNISVNQSVAILCDGNNIERSIHERTRTTNAMVNFDTLIPRLLNGRGLNRLIYFREGRNISSKLAERLHERYYGSVVACHKTADIPLSIKATQLASKVDTIIIMSGDADFIDLVRHLKSEGVRVEIAAIKETTARMIIEEADYFHPITQGDWFSYNRSQPYRVPIPKKQHGEVRTDTTSLGARPAAKPHTIPTDVVDSRGPLERMDLPIAPGLPKPEVQPLETKTDVKPVQKPAGKKAPKGSRKKTAKK